MRGLSDVVRALAARDGVEAVLLASAEGLPIHHVAPAAFEPEAVAALTATLAQHAARLGTAAARGELSTVVLEYSSGVVVLGRLDTGDWLAILASGDADIGPLLHDLRQHGPALAALL
jgi:predicted regulator of Ras-like GTPase activity (Roadblock/LC7/MglB family)